MAKEKYISARERFFFFFFFFFLLCFLCGEREISEKDADRSSESSHCLDITGPRANNNKEMYSTVPSFISLNRIFPSPPSQVPHQTLEGLSHLFTHVNSTHPITSDSLETTDGRRSFFLLGEKWCLSAWTGAFNWCQPRPLETRTSSPEDTDGPLSTQISQTQLTPSALSSKSHCLE